MAKSGTLTVKVLGDDKGFKDTMGGLGKAAGVAFAAVGVAAAAGAAKALTSFIGFEKQMNEVFTLLPGISDDAMNEMTGQVKDFSKEFGVLPDEVVPALYQSLSAGVPKDNVFKFLETAQKAAKGGVTDLTTAVDGISSVVNAYGEDIVDATKASDLMFTAVRLGKTNFEQLSASLSNVTPIASGLGVQFEDVAAGLATMTAKGVPTAQATTQLRSLFVELSKAGGKTAATFEKVAGKSFQEFIAAGGNTAEAMWLMQKAADESDVQLQDLFGSVEAGAAALTLASDTSFAENIDEMGNAAGATDAAFQQMMTGLGPVIDKLKAFAAVLMIEIGERVAPIVMTAMERAGEAFAIVSNWWNENGPAIIDKVNEIRQAIVDWINEVRPHIESWVSDNLDNMAKWWDDHGPTIIAVVEELRDALKSAIDKMVEAVRFVVDEWDKFKVAIGIAVAIMALHFGALAVAATINAAIVMAAWVATHLQAIASVVIHGVQVAIMIAKWVALGVAATVNAAVIAAAWVISMGPIALVILAIAGLAVAFALHFDKIKGFVLAGVQFVVDAMLLMAEKVIGAGVSAFGWVPGVGDALRSAQDGVARFRENVNAELDQLRDKRINIDIVTSGLDGLLRGVQLTNQLRGGRTAGLQLHAGGTFNAPRPGGEGMVLLRDGERVSTPTEPAAAHGGMVTLDPQSVRDLARALRQMERAG